MKKLLIITLLSTSAFASDIIPTGSSNNLLYYQIGGAQDFAMPAVQSTQTIEIDAGANLGNGFLCGSFNPALSIQNTLNDLKNDVNNIEQTVLTNATGSLVQMPMYFLAQANPTAYNLINNALINAHAAIDISTKSCQEVANQISMGQNPYHDWGTIAVNNQWKQNLSLTASGNADINTVNSQINQHPGDAGVTWVQGSKQSDGSFDAGGLNQPPIHVIADTVLAGFNAMLSRDLNDNDTAATGSNLANDFPSPTDAVSWITNVVGDQTITTCSEQSCTGAQSGISGRGLLPWITTCSTQNNNYCSTTILNNLTNLVTHQTPITKLNLEAVSAEGLVISPQVITAIQGMDSTSQSIMIQKLSTEIATQQVISRALIAKNLLQTGGQVPVIAANQPAQKIINQAIAHIDKDIESLSFESTVRKQMMSDTISNILNYQTNQQQNVMSVPKVNSQQPIMQNSALPSQNANTGDKNL